MTFLEVPISVWIYPLCLLVLGFVLVLLEIFVIPGFNIFGIIGFATLVLGVIHAWMNIGPLGALIVAAVGVVGTAVLVRLMLRMRAWDRLVLKSETTKAEGYDSGEANLESLLGQQGKTLTPLRPSGRAQFGERLVDVVAEGHFIERDSTVEVIQVDGNRVLVQDADV